MKKYFYMLCFIMTILSCEKSIVPESDTTSDVVKGNLLVTVFEIEHTPFSSITRTALKDMCTRLNFAIYDEEGLRIQQVNQTKDKEDFGTASFQLEPGEYMLVVVAHSSSGNPTMTNPSKIQFTNSTGYTDTFFYCTNVTIGDEDVTKQASLERNVSLCRFVITDDYPESVANMKFYYTGGSGAFNAKTGLGSVNSKQTVTCDIKDGKKQFDLYTFLHEKEGSITLKVTALDNGENVLREREFDVPLYQNQITWVSGALFNGSGSSSISISGVDVNTDWAGEHYITF